jgi:hypothetical protein
MAFIKKKFTSKSCIDSNTYFFDSKPKTNYFMRAHIYQSHFSASYTTFLW